MSIPFNHITPKCTETDFHDYSNEVLKTLLLVLTLLVV